MWHIHTTHFFSVAGGLAHKIFIIIPIINTLQHRNVDGLPATCAGSQTKN